MFMFAGNKRQHLAVLFFLVAAVGVQQGLSEDQQVSFEPTEVREKEFAMNAHHIKAKNVIPLDYDVDMTLDFKSSQIRGKVVMMLEFGEMNPQTKLDRTLNSVFALDALDEPGQGARIYKQAKRENTDEYIMLNIGGQTKIKKVALVMAQTREELEEGRGKRIDVNTVWRGFSFGALHLKQKMQAGYFGKLIVEYDGQILTELPAWSRQHGSQFLARGVDKVQNGRETIEHVYYTTSLLNAAIFPSIYNSEQKATISVAVNVNDANDKVVTNMLSSEPYQQVGTRYTRTVFEKNPVPSHVNEFALAIGPFDEPLIGESSHGIKVRVVTPNGQREKGKFALDIAKRSLDWLQEFTGVEYPFEMVTLVGSPSIKRWLDGEGLGISFINAGFLLIDEEEAFGPFWKTVAALKVANAMVHQWLRGRLVKLKHHEWEPWIREGLPAYLAMRMVRELKPESDVYNFAKTHLLEPIVADSPSAHPQRNFVQFASVMQMLERDVVGDKNKFDDIVRSLIQDPQVVTIDRLAHVCENARFSKSQIKEFLKRWSYQSFLVIDVSISKKSKLRIEQQSSVWWPLAFKVLFASGDGTNTKVEDMPMFAPENGKVVELDLPSWFDASTDSFKIIEDAEALHYFKVRYTRK